MSRYRVFALLQAVLFLALVSIHLAYALHWFGWGGLWTVIHLVYHPLGWLGAAAMLLSMLYLPRKRKVFTRGSIKFWLRFHVITGLSGCLMIFLHSYGKYYGIGGLAMGAAWLVLGTGMVGRWMYKRLPEDVEARIDQKEEARRRLDEINGALEEWAAQEAQWRADADREGLLARIKEQGRLRRSTAAADPRGLVRVFREYLASGRDLASRQRLLRKIRFEERRDRAARDRELERLLSLERNARDLILLNQPLRALAIDPRPLGLDHADPGGLSCLGLGLLLICVFPPISSSCWRCLWRR